MNRDFKGIWITKDIWLNKSLSIQEKVMLAEIDSLDTSERGCFATNEYFAELFNVSKGRISEIIASLIEKGLVKSCIDKVNGNIRTINVLYGKSSIPYTPKDVYPIPEKAHTLYDKRRTHIKDDNKDDNKIESNAFALSLWKDLLSFEQYWNKWKEYRIREKKGWFVSSLTELESLNQLFKKCNGDQSIAQETIAESISNRWTGLFPEKIVAKIQPLSKPLTTYTAPKQATK